MWLGDCLGATMNGIRGRLSEKFRYEKLRCFYWGQDVEAALSKRFYLGLQLEPAKAGLGCWTIAEFGAKILNAAVTLILRNAVLADNKTTVTIVFVWMLSHIGSSFSVMITN